MRSIPKPTLKVSDVYKDSISKVKNKGLRARLLAILPDIEAAAKDFDIKASATQLHNISKQTAVGSVTQKELEAVYTGRMAKKDQPGRIHYNTLLLAAPHRHCPLCGQGRVSTLDHHLPKEHYPALAVTPVNLIPACKDCNTVKRSKTPARAEDETLHPFFDNVEDKEWLIAHVVADPAVIEYNVATQTEWSDLKNKRVAKHFTDFELQEMYASFSGHELQNIRLGVSEAYSAGGADAAKEYLLEKERSYRHNHKNSWQAAMYKALANNTTYCSGGFNN
ncbi:MAG: hypothetical protein EOO61_03670 [Hymenobacter sp.]|nr:MAG: hypothetical protein EOO61_03670 [Hymenobacter sp.]